MTKQQNYITYLKIIETPKTIEEVNRNYICGIVNDAMNGIFNTFGFDPQLETYIKLCIENYKKLNLEIKLQDYLWLNVKTFLELYL